VLKFISNNKLVAIIIHIVIGYLATFSFFPIPFGITILLVGFIIIIVSGNKNEEALMISGYLVGVEVFLRMIKGVISYETGKYGVVLFLITGMLVSPVKQKMNINYVIYLLLLLLGIVFTLVPEGESIRIAIAFNLSGPFMLGVSAFYMYKRPISYSELNELIFIILLPIFSMITYIYFRTPDLREVVFGISSNFSTSGDFGPNQVATIVGFGMFALGFFLYQRTKITRFLILDGILLAYFTYRGLLTFSRGGIITAVVAFFLLSLFLIVYKKGSFSSVFKYLIVSSFFIVGVWLYTADITGGMLENRYMGKDASGKEKNILTGRFDLFSSQIESFKDAPLFGIGVGNGKFKREKEGGLVGASHSEVSRLIEEHGLIGIIILIILVAIPLAHFFNSNNFQRAFIISFFLFWFLTVNHSAMRIAFPGFLYAMGLIIITDDGNKQ
jgi:hypothetical protein